jgi:hypothetical protein
MKPKLVSVLGTKDPERGSSPGPLLDLMFRISEIHRVLRVSTSQIIWITTS